MLKRVVFVVKEKVRLFLFLLAIALWSACAIKRPKGSTMLEKYGQDQKETVDSDLQERRRQQGILKRQNDSALVFKQLLNANSSLTEHPEWLDSIYQDHLYKPFLIAQGGKAPFKILEYLQKSTLHGLDTNYFYLNAIGPLLRDMER